MQLTTLMTLALSASTLTIALPTNTSTTTDPFAYHEETESTLEKRGNYGWFSNYAMTDPFCAWGWGGVRPKVHEKCIKFNAISDRVGINWGSWPNGFDALDVYSDDACHTKIKTINAPKKRKDKGADTCVLMSVTGGKWRSVRNHAFSPF